MVKKNQIMITALALMIAVAGYLNFSGTKINEEEIVATGSDSVEENINTEDLEAASLLDISDEDIETLDPDGLDVADASVDDSLSAGTVDESTMETTADSTTETETGTPGEAVFTTGTSVDTMSGAKLLKEQTRAKNKETLLEIINNTNITEDQKQDAVNGMIAITEMAEKETAAEILLEAKGFSDAVVSMTDGTVDVVVNASELSQAERAQIEDIVVRKTGVSAESVVISTAYTE